MSWSIVLSESPAALLTRGSDAGSSEADCTGVETAHSAVQLVAGLLPQLHLFAPMQMLDSITILPRSCNCLVFPAI
jgi:hypothetical protein